MRFILFALAVLSFFSCGTAAGDQREQGSQGDRPHAFSVENTTRITGMVQIYGNEPHTYIGIVDENGTEYAVYSPSQEVELRKLQGYLIAFTVIMLDEPKGEGGLYLKGGTVTPLNWEIIR
jgi:phosphoribosylanthranilate isomerase